MQYKKTLLLLLRYILIYKQCNFLLVNGLIGANVREAEINEFSSAVAIVKIVPDNSWPENNFKCSATLISYRDVLTCAHCVENEEVDQVKVLVGMNNLRDGIEHLPLWWVTYDEWAEQNGVASLFPVNDLCIIRGDSGGGLYLDRNTIIAVTKSVSPSFNFYHQLSVNTHTFLYFYRDFIRLIVQHSI
ncbi:PREDICTED: uncharacterized protein LOC105363726 isoform X2 [Ceratosolen solmsi marchali]|uniref:Uncharacterized protein LOC105363726 isoform X2 n=1 Tax=Ceratosolen solmsi marchali TaxID=326594 RepID=A0AAJ6YKL2_9HYME|nr:PREDICTED: uncharacterized protein LOC105363726 isoform X2 [Ceratosolen solmsi marchali]